MQESGSQDTMANRINKDEGWLPGYAPHFTRYCTTCGEEIKLQALVKAKACSRGHPVDLRDKWEEHAGRCHCCDNIILGKCMYND